MLSDFVKYVKQYWHDRPDKSTPLNADRLNHIENGIGSNSEAINQIANAVVSNIVNDPDKIASMAAVYALQEKLGTGELPSDAPNAISAINTLYSNLEWKYVADVIGSSTINIPSDACEIFVTVTKSSVINTGDTTLSLLVPVYILGDVYQDFLNGGYGANDQQTYLAFFRINKYNAHLYALKVAGQDYTATSQLKMWYR